VTDRLSAKSMSLPIVNRAKVLSFTVQPQRNSRSSVSAPVRPDTVRLTDKLGEKVVSVQ